MDAKYLPVLSGIIPLPYDGWNTDAVGEPYYFGKYGNKGNADR